MIPDVHKLLHHLVIYGPQRELEVANRYGNGIVQLAVAEHLLETNGHGDVDIAQRFRPLLSKIIYDYTDES